MGISDEPAVAEAEERTVPMGREAPLPIRPLPTPFKPVHLIGPGIALTALGVGLGETYQWPRLVIVFGPSVRWLFLLGVTVQLVVMIEMARYTMATGESIFFGAARIWRPVMIPPAARTGTSRIALIAFITSGTSTSVETSPQCPPASVP